MTDRCDEPRQQRALPQNPFQFNWASCYVHMNHRQPFGPREGQELSGLLENPLGFVRRNWARANLQVQVVALHIHRQYNRSSGVDSQDRVHRLFVLASVVQIDRELHITSSLAPRSRLGVSGQLASGPGRGSLASRACRELKLLRLAIERYWSVGQTGR